MNIDNLQDIWKAYDHKLEESRVLNMQSWVLNLKCFEDLQKQKAKAKLNRLATLKKWAVFLGIIWVLFLLFLIAHSLVFSKIAFVISAGAIAVITSIGVAMYIRQIILIRQIDNSENIIYVQQKLAELQTSTLNIPRILFLQSPFYCTWWFTPAWVSSGDPGFWFISLPIALLFVYFSLWLYKNISYKNCDKKWFKILFNSPEWTSVIKAKDFMNEIEVFKKDMA
ncbi:MAG: hypothetical protein JSU03_01945 [Bacteroidetes bacterium]|nr:hypothetical protein [Bacteroidota bacterium]MBS1756019.1 hypothetical protein [Bacteroidota bacterium]